MEKTETKERKNEMMSGSEQGKFRVYWLFALLGTLVVSGYPVYMGCKVIWNMSLYGFVPQARYP